MELITQIFQTIGSTVTAYVGVLVDMFTSLIEIFYVPESGLTILGVLLVFTFGIGVVKFGFNLIRSLLRI